MYRLTEDNIVGWKSGGGVGEKRPNAINSICPFCGERGTFSIVRESQFTERSEMHMHGVAMGASCPTCGDRVRFVQVGKPHTAHHELYIHPTPGLTRKPKEGPFGEQFTDKIKRNYCSAVEAFNAKQWRPSAMMCGVALEGIVKALLPEDKGNQRLYDQLNALPENIDLSETISDLTHAIRKGRNIAAHFDEKQEIGPSTAAHLLDLLDYVIEYFFIIPEHVKELDDQLNTPEGPGNGNRDGDG